VSKNAVGLYTIKVSAGGVDFSSYLQDLSIITTIKRSMQIINMTLNLNREQYNNFLIPYKDALKLEIQSSKGVSSDLSLPDVDASFSYELCIIEEDSSQSGTTAPKGTSPSTMIHLTCVVNKTFKAHQKILKNKVFVEQSRKNIIEEILSGSKYKIESKVFKESEPIDQIFLPPLRQVAAIKHISHYCGLFEDAKPIYINYSIDGTIYLGSCIKNDKKPLKLYYSTDPENVDKAIGVHSKNAKSYDYLIINAIHDTKTYNSTCAAVGRKQSYCYNPMNKLFSRVVKKLNEYSPKLSMSNIYGDDPKIGEHIKKTNDKETWFKAHNGLPNVDNDSDNDIFGENYVTEHTNQAVSLIITLDGSIKFEDFIYPGRLIKMSSDLNSIKYNGDYYLASSRLYFKTEGSFWSGSCSITANTSIKLSNT